MPALDHPGLAPGSGCRILHPEFQRTEKDRPSIQSAVNNTMW